MANNNHYKLQQGETGWEIFIVAVNDVLRTKGGVVTYADQENCREFMRLFHSNLAEDLEPSVDQAKILDEINNRLTLMQLYVSCKEQLSITYGHRRNNEYDTTFDLMVEDLQEEIKNFRQHLNVP